MIIIKGILITLFIGICLTLISEGINNQLLKNIDKEKEINKQVWNLLQLEKNKTTVLYATIDHIKNTLSLLKSKDCPEEELKNIPLEVIDWIEKLQKVNKGESDGIHK